MKKIIATAPISSALMITHIQTVLYDLGTGNFGDPASLEAHSYQASLAAIHYYESKHLPPAPDVIVAAFLHDFGHIAANLFLIDRGVLKTMNDYSITDAKGLDDQHESIIAHLLKGFFSDHVQNLVGSHVVAKKILRLDSSYALTEGSLLSLSVQAKGLSDTDIEPFKRSPYFQDALLLRRFDEAGKNPDYVITSDDKTRVLDYVRLALLPSTHTSFPFTSERLKAAAACFLSGAA